MDRLYPVLSLEKSPGQESLAQFVGFRFQRHRTFT
jgi:hypothetical protein